MPSINMQVLEESRRHQVVQKYEIYPLNVVDIDDYQIETTGLASNIKEDIRIVQDNLLDQWAESKGNVWSKLDNLKAKTPQIILGLSGNPSSKSIDDGDATFDFFDDFEGNYDIINPWTRYASNPIFTKNPTNPSWDYYFVNSPYIALNSDGTPYKDGSDRYYMYYSGSGNADGRPQNDDRVGLARSTDLYNWTRITSTVAPLGSAHDGLVLDFGAGGTFDDSDTQIGSIIVKDGTFHMWYTGNANSASDDTSIGYASSSDGITWTKYGSNPILNNGAGDDNDDLYAPNVIFDSDTNQWKMWYLGQRTAGSPGFGVMHATAPASEPWNMTKYSANYVYTYGTANMWGPYVWKDSVNDYNMIFNNMDSDPYVFHWANSTDGITWTYQGIIFEVGESGEWDDKHLFWPSQINVSGTWYTYYRANCVADPSNGRIGVATGSVRIPTPGDTPFEHWTHAGSAWSINSTTKYSGSYSALGTGHATVAEERKLSNTVTRTSGVIHLRYKPVVQDNYQYMSLIDDSAGTFSLVIAHQDGHYKYYDGSWHNFAIDTTWQLGRWDNIIIDFDYGSDKYNVTINDTKISGSGITLLGAGTQTTKIYSSVYNAPTDENYYDNYFIRKYTAIEPTITNINKLNRASLIKSLGSRL